MSITNEQRVAELIKHFGLTNGVVRKYAGRDGLGSATFSRCMNNKRTFTMLELRGIADFMGISLDRLLMKDTIKMKKEMNEIRDTRSNPTKFDELSNAYLEMAIGEFEKAEALYFKGSSFVVNGEYESAEECFLKSLEISMVKQYVDIAKRSFMNILFCLLKMKDFRTIKNIINDFENKEIFKGDFMYLGAMETYRGIVAKNFENYGDAKFHYMNALHFYKLVKNKEHMGRMLSNIAEIERIEGNLNRSKTIYIRSIMLIETSFALAIAKKELAEVLDMLGENKKANTVISSAISEYAKSVGQDVEIKRELTLAKAHITSDADKALSLFDATNNHPFMVKVANFLMKHYARKNNYDAFEPFACFVGDYLYKTNNKGVYKL